MSSVQALNPTIAIPTYPQALIGYRAWRMTEDHLCALFFRNYSWSQGSNSADCSYGHTAPDPDCYCGFNAFYSLKEAQRYINDQLHHEAETNFYCGDVIIGAIAGKGAMELHKQGFRCQEAQILGLVRLKVDNRSIGKAKILYAEMRSHRQQAFELADRYQVPLYQDGDKLKTAINGLTGAETMDRSLVADLRI